jgi:hypothetical protein
MIRMSFIYATEKVSLAASATDVQSVTLATQQDAPFECNYITAHVLQSDKKVTDWGGTVQITDNATGRTLFNRAIILDAIAGSGQLPYPFSPPHLLKANSTLTVTLSNNVATATVVQICLHGNKLIEGLDAAQ